MITLFVFSICHTHILFCFVYCYSCLTAIGTFTCTSSHCGLENVAPLSPFCMFCGTERWATDNEGIGTRSIKYIHYLKYVVSFLLVIMW